MRFLSYSVGGVPGLAVDVDGVYKGVAASSPDYPGSLDDIVRGGNLESAGKRLAAIGTALDLAGIKFLPPFSRAGKILCVGLNYADHAAESAMSVPVAPTIFARFNSGLVAHGDCLVKPAVSDQLDYEAEVVAVIGKTGRAISKERALEHVAGYSVFNDGSVRDYQLQTSQWGVGKNFDGTGAFGPVFVTSDELPAGAAGLRVETRLNGKVMQSANTDDLIFDVVSLVSFLSSAMTLEAGDLIVTGTPSGVGFARKPPVFMKAGDVCEVEVEKIGILRNPVVDEVR